MTEQHSITPPPELFKQWEGMPRSKAFEAAYRAGADQELEACVEWLLIANTNPRWALALQEARRPQPPSLAEEALTLLDDASTRLDAAHENTIRRALERLQELETRQKTGFIESHDRVGTLPAPHGQWFIGKGDLVQTEIAKQKKPNVSSTHDENITRMGLAGQ